MKVSEIDVNNMQITKTQLDEIVYHGVTDEVVPSEVAFVLGTSPASARERALMAVNFYRKGGAKLFVVTGGVKHDVNGEKISEADYMRGVMIAEGVPAEAIITENRARFTSENMIFSYPEAEWVLGECGIKNVTIITSPNHIRRSVMLAQYFLPARIAIHGYTEGAAEEIATYPDKPVLNMFVRNEVRWIKQNIVERGWFPDIEF